jgi:hypothetical protein
MHHNGHIYKTFAAALLAVAESSKERTNALKAHDKEPRFVRHPNGVETVTFSSPAFTLIFHRSATAKTWGYTWTWTDTAAVRRPLGWTSTETPGEYCANVTPDAGGVMAVTVRADSTDDATARLEAMGYRFVRNVTRL